MTARRVLLTGVSGPLGARVAAALAADPSVEHVIGIDTRRPPGGLADRITFVEADLRGDELASILKVAAPQVVVHHDIVQFPEPGRSVRTLHDLNVIGTLQLLAACGELPGLRALVVRGSASIYGSEPDAPAFFTEDLARGVTLHTRFQRDVGELERLVEAFARRHPAVTCTVLRLQPVIGATVDTPIMRLFRSAVVPTFLGYDPRLQFLLDDDAVGAVAAAVARPGARRGQRGRRRDGVARADAAAAGQALAADRRAALRGHRRRAGPHRRAAAAQRRCRPLPAQRPRGRHHADAPRPALRPDAHDR